MEFVQNEELWLDEVSQLMSCGNYNGDIAYDENGNAIIVQDIRFKWSAGRILDGVDCLDTDGSIILSESFTYDEKGIRTSKTVNGKTTYYTTVDGTITSQYELDEQGEVINEIVFLYDSNGNLIGFTYGGNTYFYIKNHMNDVMGIADAGGTWLVSYTYDAYGTVHWQYETNSEIQTDIDITELAELNPMLYRSYYCDREAGVYYLQSRYYLPDFGRFFNADLPEYARLQKDDYAGTNLFAYCNNDPVNNSDPSGYWKSPVHNGYRSQGCYYSVSTKTRRYYYGTYYWAIICGFKEQDAKFLGQCCNFLDTKYPSTKYPSAIAANANGTTIIYNGKELNRFKSWQYWHFNGYKKGYNDTRRDFANDRRKVAVKNWKKDRTYALRLLAYGLHAIQDISAHGQIGRGASIPQHIFLSPKNKSLFAQADTVQGYMWSNSSRNGLIYVKGSVTRLLEAQRDTYEYLNEFIRLIGGKHKLK